MHPALPCALKQVSNASGLDKRRTPHESMKAPEMLSTVGAPMRGSVPATALTAVLRRLMRDAFPPSVVRRPRLLPDMGMVQQRGATSA